jgi:hypothetical protein
MKKTLVAFCLLSLFFLSSCAIMFPLAESSQVPGQRTHIISHPAVLNHQFNWDSLINNEISSLLHVNEV